MFNGVQMLLNQCSKFHETPRFNCIQSSIKITMFNCVQTYTEQHCSTVLKRSCTIMFNCVQISLTKQCLTVLKRPIQQRSTVFKFPWNNNGNNNVHCVETSYTTLFNYVKTSMEQQCSTVLKRPCTITFNVFKFPWNNYVQLFSNVIYNNVQLRSNYRLYTTMFNCVQTSTKQKCSIKLVSTEFKQTYTTKTLFKRAIHHWTIFNCVQISMKQLNYIVVKKNRNQSLYSSLHESTCDSDIINKIK